MKKYFYILFFVVSLFSISFDCLADDYYFNSYYVMDDNDRVYKEYEEKAKIYISNYNNKTTMGCILRDPVSKKNYSCDYIITKKEKNAKGLYTYEGYKKNDPDTKVFIMINTSEKGQINFTLSVNGCWINLRGPIKKNDPNFFN